MKKITTRWLTHCLMECRECDKTWQYFDVAQKQATDHARKTGHSVQGETGYAIKINPPKK